MAQAPLPLPRHQKMISGISMGIVQGKAAWVFHYHPGSHSSCGCPVEQESFSLHPGVARQFLQGLQEILLALEPPVTAPPLQGTQDGLWMGDTAVVRLQPPPPAEGD